MALNKEEEGVPGQKNFVQTSYLGKLFEYELIPFPVSVLSPPKMLDAILC